jgi:hypothetical protein
MIRIIESIKFNIIEWIVSQDQYQKGIILKKFKLMKNSKEIIKAVVGIFYNKKKFKDQNYFIFQGLNNKIYMNYFDPRAVIIVGSHNEKLYAENNNHEFIWSFPVTSAINNKIARNWDFYLNFQLKKFKKIFEYSKRITIFIFEDTQPLGVFLTHLARLDSAKFQPVCIQHGYFARSPIKRRYDGELTDINFLWSMKQTEVIKTNKSKTFSIGLPYNAIAKPKDEIIKVYLIGTGLPFDNNDYNKSIQIYRKILDDLNQIDNLEIYYMPHPNEWRHDKLIQKLKTIFNLIDNKNKIEILNGPQSIIVGATSSFLYEAGVASHYIVHLRHHQILKVDFEIDLEIDSHEINKLFDFINKIKYNLIEKVIDVKKIHLTPIERFENALISANLI